MKTLPSLLILFTALAGLLPALAGEPDRTGQFSIVHSYQAVVHWPEPFVGPERESVESPFAVMVHNGWRLQNTLNGSYFFENGTELSPAGRLKLQSILTEVPLSRRSVFVCRAESPDRTAARIAAVQQFAAQIAPDGPVLPVMETALDPHESPAAPIDALIRSYRATAPEPHLPKQAAPQVGLSK
jgi:hypothetical protein